MPRNTVSVYIERLEDVKPEILRQLKRLNKRGYGRMLDHLIEYGKPYSEIANAKVFYCLSKGKVVSWGMAYNWRNRRWQGADKPYTYRIGKRLEVDLYTARSHRGQGYASCIAQVMRDEYKGRRLHACTEFTSIYRRLGYRQ
jgi:GNAT superfamily N-acetyltransferase